MVVWRRDGTCAGSSSPLGRLGDWAHVMEAFESGVLDLPDFYFTGDDYRYRFETEAKNRFLNLLRERFNVGVRYNGQVLKWDSVIEQKAIGLGRYLVGRSNRIDLSEPSPSFAEIKSLKLRERILCISQSEARRLGIGKSTLHYLRNNAKERRSFRIYGRVRRKLVCQRRPNYTTLRSEFAP